ncbi:MAG TPA: hypothetical protein VE978_05700 [Chitinophagales bacterium]|nr:hypothetical protein [Chitinophagales bacterium]
MQRILFLLIVTILFSCNSDKTKHKSSPISLTDGWYLQTDKEKGVQRHLTKAPSDEIYFLENQPFISFSDIKDIKSELSTEMDSAVDVDFLLTKDGNKKWNEILTDRPNDEFVFVLGDSAIAFDREYPGDIKKRILTVVLSYSDYNVKEIKSILTAIKQDIKK